MATDEVVLLGARPTCGTPGAMPKVCSSTEPKRPSVSFHQMEGELDKPKSKLPKDAPDVREMSAQIVADVLAKSVLEHLASNQKRLGLNAEALRAARAAAHWAGNRPAAPCLHNPEAAAREVLQAAENALKASRHATGKEKDVHHFEAVRYNGKNGLSVANSTSGRTKENSTRPKKGLRSKTCVIL